MAVYQHEVAGKDRRSTRTEYLYSGSLYDVPSELGAFIEWLSEFANDAQPDETISIELTSESDYDGGSSPVFEITRKRPETDEEWAARKADVEARMAQFEAAERALLEHLKAKFG